MTLPQILWNTGGNTKWHSKACWDISYIPICSNLHKTEFHLLVTNSNINSLLFMIWFCYKYISILFYIMIKLIKLQYCNIYLPNNLQYLQFGKVYNFAFLKVKKTLFLLKIILKKIHLQVVIVFKINVTLWEFFYRMAVVYHKGIIGMLYNAIM